MHLIKINIDNNNIELTKDYIIPEAVNPSNGNNRPLSAAISRLERGSNIRSGITKGAAAFAELKESSKPPLPLVALTRVSMRISGL